MFKRKHPIGKASPFPAQTRATIPIYGIKPKLLIVAASCSLWLPPCIGHAQTKLDKKLVIKGGIATRFIWTDWKNAPENLKEATKLIQADNPETTDKKQIPLFQKIQAVLKGDQYAEVSLAIIDLNRDGILGIAVLYEGSDWCGTEGCVYELYENAGMLSTWFNDHEPTPALNGVRASTHMFYPLRKNTLCQYKTSADIPAIFKL